MEKDTRLSERLQKMRERTVNAPQEISIIRARAFTDVIKKNPELPRGIQFAKAFDESLKQLPITIADDEHIVGSLTEKQKGAILYPELKSDFLIKEIGNFGVREADRFAINDADRQELEERIMPFWKDRSAYDEMIAKQSEKVLFDMRNVIFVISNDFQGGGLLSHIGYDKIIQYGYRKIIEQAKEAAENISDNDPDAEEKRTFYQSILLSSEAVIHFAARYSELAYNMAENAETDERKQELIKIADTTARVPAEPARSFREAVQSFWFAHLALKYFDAAAELPLGRLDQILYPYYRQDIDAVCLDDAEALELVSELFIKLNQIAYLHEYAATKVLDGNGQRPTLTLGGIDRYGNDAVNELSFTMLEAIDHLKLILPNVAIRLHPVNQKNFWKRSVQMMTDGSNLVEVFNDEINIAGFRNLGYPEEVSRDYIVTGCVQPIPGSTYGPTCSAFVNGPKILELTLNGGKPFLSLSGDDEDLPVGKYNSYDELWQAFKLQLRLVLEDLTEAMNVVNEIQHHWLPNPVLSAVVDGVLEAGRDIKAGSARHNFTALDLVGLGTLADSLAAIKGIVYERKSHSLEEVVEWIKADFEGYEAERQMLLNHAPKYGNDDPAVDEIAKEIVDYAAELLADYRTYRGGRFGLGLHSETHHVIQGILDAATPDGRAAGEMLSPGSGPTSGMDRNGPTASLRSMAAVDYTKAMGGGSANLRLSPGLLNNTNGVEQFGAMLKAYFKLGGQHLQVSVVDTETLRKAQTDPDKYQDLIVRVTGYSARFIDLTPGTQEEIIRRTEMQVC